MNTAKNLIHLEVVKDMVDQEVNVLKEILLTDPTKINLAIDIWEKRKQLAHPKEQERCRKNIENLYNILEKAIDTTISVYNIANSDVTTGVTTEKDESTTMVHQPPKKEDALAIIPKEDPSKTNLRVVKDEEKTFDEYINKFDVNALKSVLMELTEEEASSIAHYILSQGLYKAKNPKKWEAKKINGFLKEVNNLRRNKNKRQETVQTAVEEIQTLEDKYKADINRYTLAEIGDVIRSLIIDNKPHEALEFATFILSKKAYKDADKEDIEWTNEAIETYINQIVEGMSSDTGVIEDAKEVPWYDITYRDVYLFVESEIKKDNATVESVKAAFIKFMSDNTEKTIERLDDYIKESNIDKAWDEYFANTVDYHLRVKNKSEAQAKFEADNKELKNTLISDFYKDNIIKKSEELSKGSVKPGSVVVELKKVLNEKGFKSITLQSAKAIFDNLIKEAKIKLPRTKTLDIATGEPFQDESGTTKQTTNESNKESVVIVGPNVPVDDKFPEIKAEVENAKYLEDIYFLSRKYIGNEEQNAYVLQLIANAFADNKVYETANSKEPLQWTIEQVQAWLNTEPKLDENDKVDAETELHPVETVEESSGESVETTADATTETPKEDTTKPAVTTEEAVDSNAEWQKVFCAANNKEKFISAVVDFINDSIEKGKEIKAIRSECANLIQFSARRDKKSFARSSYKRAQVGELHNVINKIAIAADIKGFMNEPKS